MKFACFKTGCESGVGCSVPRCSKWEFDLSRDAMRYRPHVGLRLYGGQNAFDLPLKGFCHHRAIVFNNSRCDAS
jgi:hypothetical protein